MQGIQSSICSHCFQGFSSCASNDHNQWLSYSHANTYEREISHK